MGSCGALVFLARLSSLHALRCSLLPPPTGARTAVVGPPVLSPNSMQLRAGQAAPNGHGKTSESGLSESPPLPLKLAMLLRMGRPLECFPAASQGPAQFNMERGQVDRLPSPLNDVWLSDAGHDLSCGGGVGFQRESASTA